MGRKSVPDGSVCRARVEDRWLDRLGARRALGGAVPGLRDAHRTVVDHRLMGVGRGTTAAGASTPTTLPFTGLKNPQGVAVDTADNVYVTDLGPNPVVKLPVG